MKSSLLPSLGFAIAATMMYAGVKYMVGGFTENSVWMLPVVAIIAGVGHSLPWRRTKE